MRGIVLAGGSGTRLAPSTLAASKQLLPVFDKPMIYYPLSVLMLAGVQDILIITTPADAEGFHRLLGDGSDFGVRIQFAVQPSPDGIADAFLVADRAGFPLDDDVCLILGDNIFYGHGFTELLQEASREVTGATMFLYSVGDPTRYGIAELDAEGTPIALVEKPEHPASNWAITGLYFFSSDVLQYARELQPSPRGELEITDINNRYLAEGRAKAVKLGRGYAWLDAGTHESLLQSSNFIHAIQERQGIQVACLEEIALHAGWIDEKQLAARVESYGKSTYGQYLRQLL